MNQHQEELSVKAERSQDSGDQLSPVAEDSPQESHFRPGMDGDRRDVLPSGERFPEQNYSPEGVDSYYHQGSVQPEGSLDTQYYTASQGNGDGRYSPQSSFSTPSEPAQPAAAPQAAAPARRKPSQRQRSGNLSMLRVPPKIAEKFVNLLVVGESGLGKTTFIRNCFSDLLHEDFELSDASWGSMTEFKDSPSVFCTHLPAIEVPEALIRLRYSVQDVPGYGDDMAYENSDAYVSEILALVRQQNIHQCNETQGILLEELEFKHMYDACIYFISPHQLKPRDLKFMSSISKAVPVIPVIAKADCMTEEERQVFRSHINASLQKPNFSAEGAAEPIEVFKFPEEVLEAAEAANMPLPFAIVGSRESDVIEDEEVPLRHYPWGTCLPLRKEHSDAVFFRKTVLEYGFHALREEKKARYVAFRDSLLQTEKAEEQSQQEKKQQLIQTQQEKQAQQAQEEAYYAQQQQELASQAGRKGGSRSGTQSGSSDSGSNAMLPPTPAKKPYEDYNSKKNTNFFGLKKKNSHDLQY